jgi:hypothetical protein
MKKVFILLVFFGVCGLFLGCESVQLTKENLTKQIVVDFPGMKKDAIYKKTLEWIATSFGSGKEVIEYQNKDDYKIIGNIKTAIPGGLGLTFMAGSSMTIEVKDDKARITYLLKTTSGPDWTRPIDGYEVNDAKNSLDTATESFKSFMSSKKSDSNW